MSERKSLYVDILGVSSFSYFGPHGMDGLF